LGSSSAARKVVKTGQLREPADTDDDDGIYYRRMIVTLTLSIMCYLSRT